MSWTTSNDLRKQLARWWESGRLLRSGQSFPLRIKLKGPGSRELSSDFGGVSAWIKKLQGDRVPLVFKEIKHRVIGTNAVPTHAVYESLDEVCALLKKERELSRYRDLLRLTEESHPALLCWLEQRPLKLLELEKDWPKLLQVVRWMVNNPQPGLYLRQVDLPGVDTKFLERHKGTLAELFRLSLPESSLQGDSRSFEAEFGFLPKPSLVRFRLLDKSGSYPQGLTDITLPVDELACCPPGLSRVFIVENEINFLAFPRVEDSLVIFGSGYGVGRLKALTWLRDCKLYYWGDIDTHGLAILDSVRGNFPQTQSFLMDRETLLLHREQWVTDHKFTRRELQNLTQEELELYRDLVEGRWGQKVRLEQELLGFGYVVEAIRRKLEV